MLEAAFVYAVSLPIYIIFLVVSLKSKKSFRTILFQSFFYFYVVAVIGVTLFPFPIQKSVIEAGSYQQNNFIPFMFVRESIAELRYDPRAALYLIIFQF